MEIPDVHDVIAGRYVLGEVIGTGGFAKVYRSQMPDGASCAIKVLVPDGPVYEPDTIGRFQREVEILGSLHSPHTVRLFDHGRTERGLLFAVFELVPGRDLSEVLDAEGPMAPRLVVHLMRQVLYALSEAHSAGLLHRDIKPENIRLWTPTGEPMQAKLLDFGIAKARAGGEAISVTKTGELVGTPRYMSPEQLLDQPLLPSSDIYSLGLVMLELLMGRDVLGGNTWADQLQRLRTGYVFSIPQLEYVGTRLMSILNRMTAREPQARYIDAEGVLRALDALERGEDPSMPFPTTLPEQPIASASPQGRQLVVVLSVLLVGLLSAVGILIVKAKRTQTPPPTPRARALPTPMPARPPARLDAATVVDEDVGIVSAESGCGKPAPFTGHGDFQLTDGLRRQEWVGFVPASYDPNTPHPVLILLHMDHRLPRDLIMETNFDDIAEAEGVIVIAPYDSKMDAWRDPSDVLAVQSTFEETASIVCVDRTRVFAVGHNNAGKVIERLTCEPWVTATAATSHRPNRFQFRCAMDPAPAPHLVLAPMKSGHLPLEGGENCYGSNKISLADQEKRWRERNNCTGQRKETLRHKGSTCSTWSCEQPFVICHLDGGQGWPGTPPRTLTDWAKCDGTPPEFPSERFVWDFFASLPSSPTRLDD